jgi:NAD(P)-dependent dehydrogenase (short-subunit alcohol dehydrogenase family)
MASRSASPSDITIKSEVNKTVEATLKKFGKVDILVNNLGVSVRTPILESTV